MSKVEHRICDIEGCGHEASPHTLSMLAVQRIPTGNSDYSSYEESTIKTTNIDLCEKHYKEYEKRIPLINDGKGFKIRGKS